MAMVRKRRSFTPEYKDQIARMVIEESRAIPSTAREVGVNRRSTRDSAVCGPPAITLRAYRRSRQPRGRADVRMVDHAPAGRGGDRRSADCGDEALQGGVGGQAPGGFAAGAAAVAAAHPAMLFRHSPVPAAASVGYRARRAGRRRRRERQPMPARH